MYIHRESAIIPSMSSQCPVMTQTHTIVNDSMTASTSAGE